MNFDQFFKIALLVLVAGFLIVQIASMNQGRYEFRSGDANRTVFDTHTGDVYVLTTNGWLKHSVTRNATEKQP